MYQLPPRHKSHSQRHQQQDEDESAEAAGNVAVCYIECDVGSERKLSFDDCRLPPGGRLCYFSGGGDDGGDAGVGAAGYGATGFDGP